MEVKSLLMVMATLTIAGCSQNEMTEMNPDTNRTIGLDVYTEVQTRGTNMLHGLLIVGDILIYVFGQ